MSEVVTGNGLPDGPVTAGRLLREARQSRGLHLAALASAIKVAPRKLELLESDRLDELPDATFTRALAQTVCRSLKVDAGPVLALLPKGSGYRLEQLGEGLNTPFRERPSNVVESDWTGLSRPAIWAPLLLLMAAAGVYLMPSGWLSGGKPAAEPGAEAAAPSPADAASASMSSMQRAETAGVDAAAASPAAPASIPGQGPVVAAGSEPLSGSAGPGSAVADAGINAAADAASGAATSPGMLRLRARADSWIEVLDARGQSLLSRTVRSGETVDLEGVAPLRVRVGNARDTEIVFRGRALELAPFTRDNLARLELK